MSNEPKDYALSRARAYQPGQFDPRDRELVYEPSPSYLGAGEPPSDDIDIVNLFGTLYARKFLIITCIVLSGLIGLFLVLQSTPLYRGIVKVEVQKQQTQIVEGGNLEQAGVADEAFMETQYALLNSRSLAERVVLILQLESNADFANPALSTELRTQQAASKLLANLNVAPIGASRVISVTYDDPSPWVSAKVPNTLVENFIELTLERKFNTTAYARAFLEERLAQAKITLEDAERQLVAYADDNDILELKDAGQETSLASNSLLQLNSELAEAQSERIIAEQAFIELSNNAVTSETLDSADLKRLRAKRSELEAEYQNLLGIFKPDYPDVLQVRSRINAIDSEIIGETKAIVGAAQGTYRAALARENILSAKLEGLKADLRQLRNRSIDYTILRREVDNTRSQYDALLQRLKEVSIASGVGSSQISVVDSAIIPRLPFSPNIPMIMALSLLLGGGLGIGLAFLLSMIDDTIKTPEDIKEKLRLAVLGVVPKLVNAKRDDVILEELKDPKSAVSEAYFSARTALEFSTDEGVPRSLVITSSQPEEGKTSTAVALATAFARTGRSVLIIDADMRKPSFVADAETSIGLSGLLTQNHSLEENIISSLNNGLHLLPSGVIPPNPAELLSGKKLRELIKEAESLFDVVIVDAPPMLNFTDATVLAAACRGAVVVIKSGANRTPACSRTIERLRDNRANVLGAVLTHFDASKGGYAYNYHYYAYGAGGSDYGAKKVDNNKGQESRRKIRLDLDDSESDPKA